MPAGPRTHLRALHGGIARLDTLGVGVGVAASLDATVTEALLSAGDALGLYNSSRAINSRCAPEAFRPTGPPLRDPHGATVQRWRTLRITWLPRRR